MKKRFLAKLILCAMCFMLFGCSENDIGKTYVMEEDVDEDEDEEDVDENINNEDEEQVVENEEEEVYYPVSEVIYPQGEHPGTLIDAYIDEEGNCFGQFDISEPMYISEEDFEKIKQLKTGDTFVFPDANKWPEDVEWTFYKYDDWFGPECYMFTPWGSMVYDDEEWSQGTGYNGLLDETVYLVSEAFRKGDEIGVYCSGVNDGLSIEPVYYDKDGAENTVELLMDRGGWLYIVDWDSQTGQRGYYINEFIYFPDNEAGAYGETGNFKNLGYLTIWNDENGIVTKIVENKYS